MLERLPDLQTRNIHTKPELGLAKVFYIGDQVFEILKKLIKQSKIKGAYLSHYFLPPDILPHVKAGIRYEEPADLAIANQLLDDLCEKYRDIVTDRGAFEQTTGEYQHFPPDIVVDYVICHAFQFLLKGKDDLGNILPPVNKMAEWILQLKNEITNSVIESRDIFRINSDVRSLKQSEIGWIWERFVHHLLNSYQANYDPNNPAESYELKVKQVLKENDILIH